MTTTALSELLRAAYAAGNMRGHNATVEGYFSECTEEHADEWMKEEADRIESALASAEPVAYEERMRPVWDERAPWTPWERCSRESYENFASKPNPWISNDWEIQRRSLYTHAQPAAKVEEQQREALLAVMRACDAAKQPCGSDPESSTAIRNGALASIAAIAAQGLGILKGPSLAPTPASVPDGYVIAPHFRGFADLGLGRYRMFHSRAGVEAELCIVPATPEEAAGRVVGDLRYDGPDEIPAELMAVRLRFENVAGLDALEQQLRLLRETHFLTPPTNQEGAAP